MTLTVFQDSEGGLYDIISLRSLLAQADNLTPELRAVAHAVWDAERDASPYHTYPSEYLPSKIEDGEPRQIYMRMYAVLSRSLHSHWKYVELTNAIKTLKEVGL